MMDLCEVTAKSLGLEVCPCEAWIEKVLVDTGTMEHKWVHCKEHLRIAYHAAFLAGERFAYTHCAEIAAVPCAGSFATDCDPTPEECAEWASDWIIRARDDVPDELYAPFVEAGWVVQEALALV